MARARATAKPTATATAPAAPQTLQEFARTQAALSKAESFNAQEFYDLLGAYNDVHGTSWRTEDVKSSGCAHFVYTKWRTKTKSAFAALVNKPIIEASLR